MTSCNFCGKDAGYLPFKCSYCGRYFCIEHRLPENHGCTMERPVKARTTRNTQSIPTIRQKPSVSVNSGYKYSPRTRYKPKSKKKVLSYHNFCLSAVIGIIVFICGWGTLFGVFQFNSNIPSSIQVKDGNEIVWDIDYNEQNCNNLMSHYPYFNIDTSYTQKKMNIVNTNGVEMFGLTDVIIIIDGFIKTGNSDTWEQSVDDYTIQIQCLEDVDFYFFDVGLYLFSTFDISEYYIIPNDLDYYNLAVDVCNQLGSGGYFTMGLPVERDNGFIISGLAIPGQGIVDIYVEYSGSILSSYRLNYNSGNCVTMKAIDLIPGIPNVFLWIVILIGILGLITPFALNLGKYINRWD